MAEESAEKPKYKCSVEGCGKELATKGNLAKHTKSIHLKIKDLVCTVANCDATFSDSGNRSAHIRAVHSKIKNFKCLNCDYACYASSTLKRHSHVHTKLRQFKCDECGYASIVEADLRKHIANIHLKLRRYACGFDQCKFTCSTSGILNTHVKALHLKTRDFECVQCEYKCSTKASLSTHVKRIHSETRDFVCEVDGCKFAGVAASDLRVHTNHVHHGVKPFKCITCNVSFTRHDYLRKHTITCTGERGSTGEIRIKQTLNKFRIKYDYDSKNAGLMRASKKYLRFDFQLDVNDVPTFIEYDGKHHYGPVRFGGISAERADAIFARQQTHDALKDAYCQENGFSLLRISYKDYDDIESIVLEFLEDHGWIESDESKESPSDSDTDVE